MEMQQYAGKCECGTELNMRIMPVEKDTDPKKEVMSWVIHGFCEKCKYVYVQGLFFQEEKPVQDIDYIIDWTKRIKKDGKKISNL